MTNIMLSIVIEVSAIFVAKTIFLAPGGVGSKILVWRSDGSEEYIGAIIKSPILLPKVLILVFKSSSAYSISS